LIESLTAPSSLAGSGVQREVVDRERDGPMRLGLVARNGHGLYDVKVLPACLQQVVADFAGAEFVVQGFLGNLRDDSGATGAFGVEGKSHARGVEAIDAFEVHLSCLLVKRRRLDARAATAKSRKIRMRAQDISYKNKERTCIQKRLRLPLRSANAAKIEASRFPVPGAFPEHPIR
jgi:hypothetical protein